MNERNWQLPDPFVRQDGTRIRKAEEWNTQRAYLKQVLAEHLYGTMPDAPGNIRALITKSEAVWGYAGMREEVFLEFGPEHQITTTVTVYRPLGNRKYIPVLYPGGVISEERARLSCSRGMAVITYSLESAPDGPEIRECACRKAYPACSWRGIAMWAWIGSRVIDWMATKDWFNCSRLIVTGHSRFGKAALCLGIFDDRVQVTAAAGSGCGGMGSLRVGGGRLGRDTGDYETLGFLMHNFSHWFLEDLKEYGTPEPSRHGRENELAFDADFIGAAIAPRGLLCLEGLDDTWSNPFGTYSTWQAVSEVYHFLGADEKCAVRFREGGHEYSEDDWNVMMDFAGHVLTGSGKKTGYKTRTIPEKPAAFAWRNPLDEGKPWPDWKERFRHS